MNEVRQTKVCLLQNQIEDKRSKTISLLVTTKRHNLNHETQYKDNSLCDKLATD